MVESLKFLLIKARAESSVGTSIGILLNYNGRVLVIFLS